MTIPFFIQIASPTDREAEIDQLIRDTFEEVHRVYNKWNRESEISKFNQSRSITPQPISRALYDLLKKTDSIVHLTEGRFDPTIEPLQRIWKQALLEGKIPFQYELDAIKPAIGWENIHFDERFLWKDHPDLEIDLGGIAKGYAVDLLFERLTSSGFHSLYVEWGGEIRVSSKHTEGRSWKIGIKTRDQNRLTQVIELSDQSVATSGDYEQNWSIVLENGEKITYFHIFDRNTLSPLKISQNLSSATVIAPQCWLADGLATASLFFRSKEEAEKWSLFLKKQYPELSFYFDP